MEFRLLRILIILAGVMGADGVILAAASAHQADATRLAAASSMLLFHATAVLAVAAGELLVPAAPPQAASMTMLARMLVRRTIDLRISPPGKLGTGGIVACGFRVQTATCAYSTALVAGRP